jgi:hypothetical protein
MFDTHHQHPCEPSVEDPLFHVHLSVRPLHARADAITEAKDGLKGGPNPRRPLAPRSGSEESILKRVSASAAIGHIESDTSPERPQFGSLVIQPLGK